MSLHRRNPRRDANEPEVVEAIQKYGAKFRRLNIFDLLVLRKGRVFMLEVKTPKGQPTKAQEELIAEGWPLCYVHDPIEALRAIGAVK